MTNDIKLTASGEIDFSTNEIQLVSGADAIAQDMSVRFQFFQGEWRFDTRWGMPYYQKILGQKTGLAAIKSIFRDAILKTPGVETLNDLVVEEGSRALRSLSVSFRATGTDGEIVYNRELVFE